MRHRNLRRHRQRIILTVVMLCLCVAVCWWVLTRNVAPRYLCDDVRAAGRPGCTHPGTTTPLTSKAAPAPGSQGPAGQERRAYAT